MIFGTLNPEKNWHKRLTDLSISPVSCRHFTLGSPKKSFSTVLFIHTSDYFRYLRRKQTVIHLSTPPEYDRTICTASAICPVATITVSTCHLWGKFTYAIIFSSSMRRYSSACVPVRRPSISDCNCNWVICIATATEDRGRRLCHLFIHAL